MIEDRTAHDLSMGGALDLRTVDLELQRYGRDVQDAREQFRKRHVVRQRPLWAIVFIITGFLLILFVGIVLGLYKTGILPR